MSVSIDGNSPERISVACRLHVIVAEGAEVAVVFRRGPAKWWHLLRWDLRTLELESGAWLKGQLYPRRAGISPDGRLLGYFALKGEWGSYFAISKLPWATALAAWKTPGTHTIGCAFGPKGELLIANVMGDGQPFHGRYPYPVEHKKLVAQWGPPGYWQEYQRGWQVLEEEDSLNRWEMLRQRGVLEAHIVESPPLFLETYDKRSRLTLGICDIAAQQYYGENQTNRSAFYYLLESEPVPDPLQEARWAGFDHDGRLLVATSTGALQCYEIGGRKQRQFILLWEQGLNDLSPEPGPAPDWARRW